jgi:uncharacterized protein YjbI with pentapeptide repeats
MAGRGEPGAPRLPAGAERLAGVDLTDGERPGLRLEELVLEAPVARGARLTRLSALDVRVDGGDLANLAARGAALVRVRADGARLTGAALTEGSLQDVVIADCRCDLASLAGSRLRRVRFEDCDLRGLDLRGAELDGVRFERCDLSGADLSGARCRAAELATCRVEGLEGLDGLRGSAWEWPMIVEHAGALAAALGIAILEEDARGPGAGGRKG